MIIPHNGQRVADVGTGILLDDKRPVTAHALREGVDRLLREPSYREKATYFGQTLRNAGGSLAAV